MGTSRQVVRVVAQLWARSVVFVLFKQTSWITSH